MSHFKVTSVVFATILLSVVSAVPPQRFFSRQKFARQEIAPPQDAAPPSDAPSQGYGPPPTPAPSYGPPPTPAASYGPPPTPAASYGPPPNPSDSYGPPAAGTTEVSITTDANSESVTIQPASQEGVVSAKLRQQGHFYYIYHPNGVLEKLTIKGAAGVPSFDKFGRLMQRNDEPLRGAVYTYDPDTLVLRRV